MRGGGDDPGRGWNGGVREGTEHEYPCVGEGLNPVRGYQKRDVGLGLSMGGGVR